MAKKNSGAIYGWSTGLFSDLSAQLVGETVESIRAKNDGLVSAEDLLAAAGSRRSPLHKCFEWDDSVAAHKYRLDQAAQILRALVVTIPYSPIDRAVRAFVNVTETDGRRGYTSMVSAMADEAHRKQILQRAFRELQVFQKRYEEYEELAAVMRAIDQTVTKKRKKA